MKKLLLFLFLIISVNVFAQPANDNCRDATTLTVNGSLLCGTTNGATSQTGEYCAGSGAGISPRTIWYRFTATNTTHIINLLRTNDINCFGRMSVYGPNSGCLPTSSSAIYDCVLLNGDPGVYPELNGLTVGATYLIQYNGQDCGGSSDRFHNICIGVYSPAPNNTINNPLQIDFCGTTYSGTTQGGYSASGTGTRRANFDNSNSTCSGCSTGDDVPYVINNDSWYTFCSTTSGTWNVTFNVTNCVFSGTNSGAQMTILTGSPSSLLNLSNAPNPTRAGDSWTSPNITLAANQCAYLVVDGFAGDACTYNYTLTNVSGLCLLLSNNFITFDSKLSNGEIDVFWTISEEGENSRYLLERSGDGIIFSQVFETTSLFDGNLNYYNFTDRNPLEGYNYYRIKTINIDGSESLSKVIVNYFSAGKSDKVGLYPNPTKNEINLSRLKAGTKIEILDFDGKILFSQIVSEQVDEYKINVVDLKPGVFVLKITTNEEVQQLMFIKK